MAITTSIDANAGRLFTLKASDGGTPPTFLTIGGCKSTRMTLNAAPVDITNVASNGWREYLPGAGVKEMTVAIQGVFDSRTPGARKVWDAAMAQGAGGYIEAQLISGHGDSFVGTWVVENYERSGEDANAETFSASIKSSGPPQYISAP
jgi:predicted secreted protein